MDEDIANFSIEQARKLGASYAEARLESTTANSLVMKNGTIEASSFDSFEGIGIRFIINKKLGFVSTNELTKKRISEILEKGLKITKGTKSLGENTQLSKEKAQQAKYEVKQKIQLADIGVEQKIQLLQDAEKAIQDTKVSVPSRYVVLSDTDCTEYFTNSDGAKILAHVPKMNFYYFLTINANQKVTQRYWVYGASGGWEQVLKWNIPKIFTEEVTSMSNILKKGIKTPQGVMPIVCGPQVSGIMAHESCGHPFEADRILGREAAQAGESYVQLAMKGKKMASSIVSIADDPTITNSYGYFLYDNEGVKARRKLLIKDGKVNEFLQNRETAFELKTKSNGSSRASDFEKEPIIRMSNTFMLPGDYKEEELFEGIKKGIYMKNFMEWNIDDRRLNQKYTGAEAYLIENGEISTPVISPILEVSSLKMYPAIDAMGKNLELHAGDCGKGDPMQGIPVTLGGPSIRLQGLRIK
ncbi:TldD/PmbA family protein [Candidatus Woesearchaeota archaeon]|nr:TldD/PmbA family protein [Candidatus Woesearchaeota archaeon]